MTPPLLFSTLVLPGFWYDCYFANSQTSHSSFESGQSGVFTESGASRYHLEGSCLCVRGSTRLCRRFVSSSKANREWRAIFSAFSSLINSSPGIVCPALIKTAAAAASVRQHFPGAASFALCLIPQLHASKTSSGSLISSRSPAAARPLTSPTFFSPFLPPEGNFSCH